MCVWPLSLNRYRAFLCRREPAPPMLHFRMDLTTRL